MESIYYDPQRLGSYGGVKALKDALGKEVDLHSVKDWLRGQDTYTLHKGVNQRFPRRITEIGGEGQQLQADLMDIRAHSAFNEGYNFLLTCVDVFSRRAWVEPIKNKSGEKVAEALAKILEGQRIFYLQTDKGKEFYNERVKQLLQSKQIEHFSSENETIKASIVERFNRTLREKLHRYMTAKNSKRILHVLADFVDTYNRTKHSATGFAPANVGPHNREIIHQKIYLPWRETMDNDSLTVGDFVRITKFRGAFKRGYTPNWTQELFIIHSKDGRTQPWTYKIKDQNGEVIQGSFYEEELQKVKEPETYKVEAVLRSRRLRGGRKQHLVKWMGYPDSFNSWVDDADMI